MDCKEIREMYKLMFAEYPDIVTVKDLQAMLGISRHAAYCHPQDAVKLQAAKLMQDLLNNQNPCYVAFMKNKNRKPKKAG